MATGVGYNPYRDAEGKFSRPEDVDKKIEGDLEASYAANDFDRAKAIENYVMDRMPESRIGKQILESNYGVTPEPRKRGISAEEQALRERNADLARKIVELRAAQGDVTFDDANPERARRRLAEAIEFARGRGNTNLVTKLTSAKVLPSGAFQRKSDKKRVNTDAAIKSYVAEKEIEAGREKIQRAIQAKIDGGAITEGKYTFRDDSGTYSLTVAPAMNMEAYEALDERTRTAISSPRESLSIELAREHLTEDQLAQVTTEQQVMDFVVGKRPEIEGVPTPITAISGRNSEQVAESGLKNLSIYTQSVNASFGSKAERSAKKADSAEIIKSAVAERGQNTFIPGRAYANGALVSTRAVLNGKEVQEKLTAAQIRSITAVTLQPDPVKAKSILSKEQYAAIFERQTASLRVTPKRTK